MAAKEYDKILTRLTTTLTMLSNGDRPSMHELAEEFNVSLRTIQRDIYDRLINFPIETDDEKRLRFIEGFSLNRTRLSPEELITMSLSLNLLKDAGGKFKHATENLFHKLLEKHDLATPYHIKPINFEKIDLDSVLVDTIENAIYYNNVSVITLENKCVNAEPYKIVNLDGIWYLLAKDLEDSKVKTFFLHKIKKFSPTPETFLPRKDINSVLNGVYSGFFEDGNAFDVTVKVYKKIAHFFKLKDHLSSQEIVEELPSGDLVVKFKVTTEEDIDNIVKSWLPDIEVLEPLAFRESLKEQLQKYLQNI